MSLPVGMLEACAKWLNAKIFIPHYCEIMAWRDGYTAGRQSLWNDELVETYRDFKRRYKPLRPLDDDKPDLYSESPRDYAENNMEIVVEFLDSLAAWQEITPRQGEEGRNGE